MALETSLWKWVEKARLYFGAALHIQRIENWVAAGTPDVEGYLQHTENLSGQFWLELKSSERPARELTPVRFKLKKREAQIEWMKRRWELGGNAFWLLQVGSGYTRSIYLMPGFLGDRLQHGMTEGELWSLCCNQEFFKGKSLHQADLIKRIISCRSQLHFRSTP